jgi:hypothetical protein
VFLVSSIRMTQDYGANAYGVCIERYVDYVMGPVGVATDGVVIGCGEAFYPGILVHDRYCD